MRRSAVSELTNSDSRAGVNLSWFGVLWFAISSVLRWLWQVVSLTLPAAPLNDELKLLAIRYATQESIRLSLSEAQRGFKPLLIFYLSSVTRVHDEVRGLLVELIAAHQRLSEHFELFACAHGSRTYSERVITQILPSRELAVGQLCKIACVLPFAFSSALIPSGRSDLSSLMTPLANLTPDRERVIIAKLRNLRLELPGLRRGLSGDAEPRMIPNSPMMLAFHVTVDQSCSPKDVTSLLCYLADYCQTVIAPIASMQEESNKLILEARRLRRMQEAEYERALAEDRERLRKKEEEMREQERLIEMKEAELERKDTLERGRRAVAQRMIEAARAVDLESSASKFVELSVRINGVKLLCCCDPEVKVVGIEEAIKHLDLLLIEADTVQSPLLLVGHAESGVVPAMIVEGGNRWQRQIAPPPSADYGLVSSVSSQPLAREESLVKNGIESKCSMLWGRLPSDRL